MPFATDQSSLTHFRELEISARRTHGMGALHPDRCPKLRLHGVDFAIPPRGARIAPTFKDGKVTVDMPGGDGWPEADELLAATQMVEFGKCDKCGQPQRTSVEIDLAEGASFLSMCFSLAAKLLRKQYNLDDAQASEVLGFEAGVSPDWIAQLLRWCSGLGTEAPPEPEAWQEPLVMPSELDLPTSPAEMDQSLQEFGVKKRWWQVWKKRWWQVWKK